MSNSRRVAFPWEFGGEIRRPCALRWSNPPQAPFGFAQSSEDECWWPIDPRRRRQLSDVIVLGRGPVETRAGLVLRVRPDLSNRAVGSVASLDVVRIGAAAIAVCEGFRGISVMVPAPGRRGFSRVQGATFSVTVELVLGEVRSASSRSRDAEAEAWIASELDGELLDHLHRESLSFDGVDADGRCRVDLIREWEPGQLLRFAEAYPRARNDAFRIRDRNYYVDDRYCPEPTCPCGKVSIEVFGAATGVVAPERIGEIRLEPPFTEAELDASRPTDDALLLSVLERYRDRYPNAEHFEERTRRVTVVGALLGKEIAAARRRTPFAQPKPQVNRRA